MPQQPGSLKFVSIQEHARSDGLQVAISWEEVFVPDAGPRKGHKIKTTSTVVLPAEVFREAVRKAQADGPSAHA